MRESKFAQRVGGVVLALMLGLASGSDAQCVEGLICDTPGGAARCVAGVCTQPCCNMDDVCGAPCPCQGKVGSQVCFQGICRCCVGGSSCPAEVCDLGPLQCVCDQLTSAPCGNPPSCCPIGNVCVEGICSAIEGTADLSLAKVWTYGSNAKEIIFTLRVDNNGPEVATDVVIADPLPLQVDYVSSSSECRRDELLGRPVIICGFERLLSEEHRTVDIVTKRIGKVGFENQAEVVAKEPDPNLTNNRATARVGLGADCTDKVRIRSGPAKRAFKPTATEPSRKRAILEVVNKSDVSVDVRAIEALDDELFAVEGVLPALTRTIRPGKGKRFLVGLVRAAGTGQALATRPYFRVTIECGGN